MPPWFLILLVGCGRIGFDPGGGDDGDDDPVRDAPGAVTGCIDPSPSLRCAFPGGLPCSCWGTSVANNASVAEGSGNLRITPNANTAGANGACVRNGVPFGAAGAFVEVSRIVSGSSGQTGITLSGVAETFALTAQGVSLVASDRNGIVGLRAYDPSQTRWWRIRPVGTSVVFETAPDGKQWTTFATGLAAGETSHTVSLYGATGSGDPSPGFAQIEGVNVCPP